MTVRFSKFLLTLIGVGGCLSTTVQARTINWGDAFLGTDVTSQNVSLDGTFTFELGTFGSFDPDAGNVTDWRTNWKLLDTEPYNSSLMFASSQVGLGYVPAADGDPAYLTSDYYAAGLSPHFAEGEQVYIWVYNSLSPTPGSEWGLFTNATWTLPTGAPTGQPELPVNWYIPNSTESPYGSTSVVSGQDSFQTEGFAAVPEPDGALLLGLLGLGIILRRRA